MHNGWVWVWVWVCSEAAAYWWKERGVKGKVSGCNVCMWVCMYVCMYVHLCVYAERQNCSPVVL